MSSDDSHKKREAEAPNIKKTKRKHQTLTLETKLQILKKLDQGCKLKQLSDTYNVGRATIFDIRKNREQIERYVANASETTRGKRKTLKLSTYTAMEEELYAWYVREKQNAHVTGTQLKHKALEIYNRLYNGLDNFRASDGWLMKFKNRYNIRLTITADDKYFSNEDADALFITKLQKKVEEKGISAEQVYCAEHCVWSAKPGNLKEKHAFLACSNAKGTHKHKLLVIGEINEPVEFKNAQLPVIYKYKKTASITKEVFLEWFHGQFVPEVRLYLEQQQLPPKALLVLESTTIHSMNDSLVSDDGFIETLFLTCKSAQTLHPMNQNILCGIITNYKKKLLLNVVNIEKPMEKFVAKMNMMDVVFTLTESWRDVPPQAIQASWDSICSSETVNNESTDDNKITLEELLETASDKKGTEYWEIMENWCLETKEKEISSVSEEDGICIKIKEEVTDQETCVADLATSTVMPTDALEAIDTSIQWAKENEEHFEIILSLRKLREKILLKLYYKKKEDKSLDMLFNMQIPSND